MRGEFDGNVANHEDFALFVEKFAFFTGEEKRKELLAKNSKWKSRNCGLVTFPEFLTIVATPTTAAIVGSGVGNRFAGGLRCYISLLVQL